MLEPKPLHPAVRRTDPRRRDLEVLGDGALELDERVGLHHPRIRNKRRARRDGCAGPDARGWLPLRSTRLSEDSGLVCTPRGLPSLAPRLDTGYTAPVSPDSASRVIAELVERRTGLPFPGDVQREMLNLGFVLPRTRDDQEVDPWGPCGCRRPPSFRSTKPE